jgi:hypothetical protein
VRGLDRRDLRNDRFVEDDGGCEVDIARQPDVARIDGSLSALFIESQVLDAPPPFCTTMV